MNMNVSEQEGVLSLIHGQQMKDFDLKYEITFICAEKRGENRRLQG